jgi:hypothetical protein
MKYSRIVFLLLTSIFTLTFYACRPKVDEPDASNCFITKADNLELNNEAGLKVSGSVNREYNSTILNFDTQNRPIRISYFDDDNLINFDQFTYSTDGTLIGGVSFDSDSNRIGTIVFSYDNNKKLTQYKKLNTQADNGIVRRFNYSNTDTLASVYQFRLSSFQRGIFVTSIKFRYEYDNQRNIKTRFAKTLSTSVRNSTDAALSEIIPRLEGSQEVANIIFSDYDDKFNPFLSFPALGAVFNKFPSVNNPRKEVWNYVDSQGKYADVNYEYQYNRRGFPFLIKTQVKYTDAFKRQNEIVGDFIQNSSIEYECK